jgi:hypothetical protein
VKHKMIMKQQVQYTSMIDRALKLCDVMLSRSETLYPFAVLSIDKQIHCVFLDDTDFQNQHPNGAHFGMIEKLERQLALGKIQAQSAIGMLVYAATITSPQQEENDALMFSICDANGENTLILYPYRFEVKSIKIGKPFTCDFSD